MPYGTAVTVHAQLDGWPRNLLAIDADIFSCLTYVTEN